MSERSALTRRLGSLTPLGEGLGWEGLNVLSGSCVGAGAGTEARTLGSESCATMVLCDTRRKQLRGGGG